MAKPLADLDDYPAARNCTYLDAASVAIMYRAAAETVIDWQRDLADYGTQHFTEAAEVEIFDALHDATARLFNARPEDIAVASSETVLMSSVAWAVAPPAGTNIVGCDVAHPSTIYPWLRVARHTGCEVRWARGRDHYVSPDEIVRLIDDDTAVVCVSHVEYGGGQRYDLAALAEVAHAHHALLIVDATQSAGQCPIDVAATGVDVLAGSAYKWLCGPFGVAALYVAPHLQTTLEPGLVGWRSHKDMWDFQADRLEYPDTAQRFEFGTMAYGNAAGLAKAITNLVEIGVDRIFEHNKALGDALILGLEDRNAQIVSPRNDDERSSIVAARFPGHDAADVARALGRENVVVSLRKDFIRFSPHLYNDADDVQKALQALDRIID